MINIDMQKILPFDISYIMIPHRTMYIIDIGREAGPRQPARLPSGPCPPPVCAPRRLRLRWPVLRLCPRPAACGLGAALRWEEVGRVVYHVKLFFSVPDILDLRHVSGIPPSSVHLASCIWTGRLRSCVEPALSPLAIIRRQEG
jgi:hypothetical protein